MSSIPVLVGPQHEKPTHHLSLTDAQGNTVGLIAVNSKNEPDDTVIARNPVERSSLKTSTGQSQYSDLRPPYTVIAQADWSGGRASAKLENDATRFYDSLRINTGRAGRAILQGRETYATGFRSDVRQLPGSMKFMALVDNRGHLAIRKNASASFTTVQIWAWVRYIGTPSAALTVRLRADNAGAISTVLQTTTLAVADISPLVSELRKLTISAESIVSGTPYWVEVYGGADDDEENHWEIGLKAATGTTYQSSDGSTWAAASNMDLYFRVVDAPANGDGYEFDYKGMKYFVSKPADGSAAQMWINGVRGTAISNAADLSKLNAQGSPGWVVDELVGGIAILIAGTGATETQNWRVITANDANSLILSEDWLITHDITTDFVVVGVDAWHEITGHGLTKPVTCVKVSSKDVVYLCQGEEAIMRRMREYNNSGTWTREFDPDSTSKAVFLEEYNEAGTMKLLRSNGDTTISKSSNAGGTPVWDTDITWATAQAVGNAWDRITNLYRYVDESQDEAVWVMKESGPWVWIGGTSDSLDRIKLDEFQAVASAKNGKAVAKQNVYLWYSVTNSIHRFYYPTLDDVGPTLDEGLPTGRQGPIVSILAYPGRLFVAIDAGAAGYSSVLENTGGSSWHEIYRAPYGERIYCIGFQVIPGSSPDRLWIRQGSDMVWMPFPSDTFDPYQDSSYTYTHEGVLTLASMYAGLMDAWKNWHAIKTHAENLVEDVTWLEADYRLDDEADWHAFPDRFEEIPISTVEFGSNFGASSKKIDARIRFYSTDQTKTPKLLAVIVEAVTVTAPKFAFSFSVKMSTKNLQAGTEELAPYERVQKLDEWSGTAQPLKLGSNNPLYDGLKVFLQPLPARPIATAQRVGESDYILSVVIQEA